MSRFALILMSAILCLPTVQAAAPAYHGLTLGHYLLDLLGQFDDGARREDIGAIRQIGTNGIPTLIDLVSVNEKNVKSVLWRLQDHNLTYYYNFSDDKADSLDGLNGLGMTGFDIWEQMLNQPFRNLLKYLTGVVEILVQ